MNQMKAVAKKILPKGFRPYIWWLTDTDYRREYMSNRRRVRRLRRAQHRAWPVIIEKTGGQIAAGPFKGLRYLTVTKRESYTQKLLGTYEKELAAIVEKACQNRYERVLDIGAAEGYYVCGMAYRLPHAEVIGFEADDDCHSRLYALAKLNGLQERIQLSGVCSKDSLRVSLEEAATTLVICDVEGECLGSPGTGVFASLS